MLLTCYRTNHDTHIRGSQISSHRNEEWFSVVKYTYQELLRIFVHAVAIRSVKVNISAHVVKR